MTIFSTVNQIQVFKSLKELKSIKIETKRAIQSISETKIWFLDKINKIDKPLSKLAKRQSENMEINKIRK